MPQSCLWFLLVALLSSGLEELVRKDLRFPRLAVEAEFVPDVVQREKKIADEQDSEEAA